MILSVYERESFLQTVIFLGHPVMYFWIVFIMFKYLIKSLAMSINCLMLFIRGSTFNSNLCPVSKTTIMVVVLLQPAIIHIS